MSTEYITLESLEEDFDVIQSKFENLRNIPATIVANKYIDEDGLKYFAEKLENKIMGKLSARPTFEHKCHNCGGTLVMDIDNHIFNCPYCDSVYALGTSNIFDVIGGGNQRMNKYIEMDALRKEYSDWYKLFTWGDRTDVEKATIARAIQILEQQSAADVVPSKYGCGNAPYCSDVWEVDEDE